MPVAHALLPHQLSRQSSGDKGCLTAVYAAHRSEFEKKKHHVEKAAFDIEFGFTTQYFGIPS